MRVNTTKTGKHAAMDSARRDSTAVIAALSFWDYADVAITVGSDAFRATGRCLSVAAGRVAFTHGFKGIYI